MSKKANKVLIIMLLAGIFMGALDTAIISPARAVMGNTLHVSADASIWIITLYSLLYAISMPIIGKLADRRGMKTMFTISVTLFGIGSLLCGLSDYYGNFNFLLVSRAIEAIGAGGVTPIATAFIGSSFPPEKRGKALGLVGAMNGIATLIGPALGSLILEIFGANNWGILFYINVPIVIVVLIVLLSNKMEEIKKVDKPMDFAGSIVSGLFIISLMLFITNLNFVDLAQSFKSVACYPYLIAAIILLPILIIVESKAKDPIINLKYFKNRQMVLVFIMAFLVGASLMVVVFIPQFCSNVLKLKLGSGGYFVTIMAVFTGLASPVAGRFMDKMSSKIVLSVGFISTIIGTLVLGVIVTSTSSMVALIIGLIFLGFGIGFTMGTPLNYVIQTSVPRDEVGSAQSTLSLIRSLGIALSPNLLVGFIAQAGANMPGHLMAVLPKAPGMSALAKGAGSTSMVNSFQNANVASIYDVVKEFVINQFHTLAPSIEAGVKGHLPAGVTPQMAVANMQSSYMDKLANARGVIEHTYQTVMNAGFEKMFITLAIVAALALIAALCLPKNMKKVS